MKKISAVVFESAIFIMAVFIVFPCRALSMENKGLEGLREQVEVLDQARQKAEAELSEKEEQGIATNRDTEHFRTVTTLLQQRIAKTCRHLVVQGGRAASAGLPCPNSLIAEATGPGNAETNDPQTTVTATEKQELITAVQKKPEVVQALPETSFWGTVRHFLESIFSRKTQASGDEAGNPEQQQAAAEKEHAATEDFSARDRAEEGTWRAAGSAQQEQARAGEKQRAGSGREEKPQNSGMQQAAEVGNTRKQQPAAVEQTGKQSGTAAVEPEENVHHKNKNKASRDQGQGIPGTAVQKTGVAENKGQRRSKEGTTLHRQDAKPATAGSGEKKDQKQGRSRGAETEIKEKTSTGATPGVEVIPGAGADIGRLEESLRGALEEFDGKLLSEQERFATRLPRQREGAAGRSGGYSSGTPGSSAGGPVGTGEQHGNGQQGAGGSGQAGSLATVGSQSGAGAARSSIDTDDDIVARQLREAAEQETDPVLEKKLWQEYHKYKQDGQNQ